MKKSQKSKIVLCSILGLAAISIGSVGFATWLVGVNKTTETLQLEAKVDDTKNDSIYLEATITSNSFVVAERTEHDKKTQGGIVGASINAESDFTVNANALKFTFSSFKLSVGKGVTSTDYPKKVVVDFNSEVSENSSAYVDSTVSKIDECTYQKWNNGTSAYVSTAIGDDVRTLDEGETKFSYIKYHEEFNLEAEGVFTKTDKTTYWEYELINKNREFSWGSFFGGKSPVNFYNDLYNVYNPSTGDSTKNYMTGAELFNFADKINAEIQGLNSPLGAGSAKTLVINVATSTEAISA